ncbi:MAG: hypothetical protein M1376_20140 [Planctomycetes bacterium]|nr:hypothetical protein [Planctomycetota bacterium]
MKNTRTVRSITIFGVVMVLALLLAAGTALACGVRTPGYWKTHPDDWPLESISIGADTYTKAEALDYLLHPVPGDKSYTLFSQLVSVILNHAAYNSIDVLKNDGTFYWSVQWCQHYPPGSDVRGNSDAWKIGEPLAQKLDDYNNGLLGVPAAD